MKIISQFRKEGDKCVWVKFICPQCHLENETRKQQLTSKRPQKTCKRCAELNAKNRLQKSNLKYGVRTKSDNLYGVWGEIKKRCYNKNHRCYNSYGGKGVTICDEWKNDYPLFKQWALDNGYKKGLQIDKDILCDKQGITPKIYAPHTCQFITKTENIAHRNKNY